MFDDILNAHTKTQKRWTFFVALVGEIIAVGLAVLIPIMVVPALPAVSEVATYLATPSPPPPPPPPPPSPPAARPHPTKTAEIRPKAFLVPRLVPKQVSIQQVQELPPPTEDGGLVAGVPGGLPGGVPGGVVGGVLDGIANSANRIAPPPLPPVEKATAVPSRPSAPQRIRVGGNAQEALLTHRVEPAYPQVAKQARVQGVVRLNAVISREGTIQSLSVISGHPLLVPSAVEAVKQWLYKPTLLNGVPVEVSAEIDVTFQLH